MKTRRRSVKTLRKTLKGGTAHDGSCSFSDNIADMTGAASPHEINGQILSIWADNNNGYDKGQCWINAVLYLFFCNKYVMDILHSRFNNLNLIYPTLIGEDDPACKEGWYDFFMQYKDENSNDETNALENNIYPLALEIWKLDSEITETKWNTELYKRFYDLFILYNRYDIEKANVPFGKMGDAQAFFYLILGVFERNLSYRPTTTKHFKNPTLQRRDWKKLLDDFNYKIKSTEELCQFLQGSNNNIIKQSKTGYTCIGFVMSDEPFVANENDYNKIQNVKHYVSYARVTSQEWRKFSSGKTMPQNCLLKDIINPNKFPKPHFGDFFGDKREYGYFVHGLFVRNDFLPKKNEVIIDLDPKKEISAQISALTRQHGFCGSRVSEVHAVDATLFYVTWLLFPRASRESPQRIAAVEVVIEISKEVYDVVAKLLEKNYSLDDITRLSYYSGDLIRKENLIKWMQDVDAIFEEPDESQLEPQLESQSNETQTPLSEFAQGAFELAQRAEQEAVGHDGADRSIRRPPEATQPSEFAKDAYDYAILAESEVFDDLDDLTLNPVDSW